MTIIGRDFEKKKLTEIVESDQPAFVAIYGRRRVINLFEIKFSINSFEITKDYDLILRNKIAAFQAATKTTKAVFLAMITTFGLIQNEYAKSIVQNDLTMNDLFV